MNHDKKINIAVGMRKNSLRWKNKKVLWSNFAHRLRTPVRTSETVTEFWSSSKQERSDIKDVGGYVGGLLRNGRRKPENLVHRQILTLDVDFASKDFPETFFFLNENASIIHSTHSHKKSSPRYRLIAPLSREVTADEYVAVARRIAGNTDIELFDNTGFQPYRLMYWPSVSKDAKYVYKVQDGPWINVDEVLDTYEDWTDSSQWPTSQAQLDQVKDHAAKQEDPETKKGLIGAFCRTYTIPDILEDILLDEYERVTDDRYTYTKGSTSGGLIVYDDKFAYSHHGTDPCSGKLCNAFDLVRIHKFGHLDEGSYSKILPSFKAMEDYALEDPNVRVTFGKERLENARYDFAEDYEDADHDNPDSAEDEEENLDWLKKLESNKAGKYHSSAGNLNIIFANDIRLSGAFKLNLFDRKKYLFKSVPWRKIKKPEPMTDVDYAGIRNYLESLYGIASAMKIDDALALVFNKHSFHPIKKYLKKLKWDGVKRIDTLLIDFFGAADNVYTRQAIRKTLCGAVARIFKPGIKFDLVLTLKGDQGTFKSTFVNRLGKNWYSDSFHTVQGKDAFEQLQGAWIIEMAELAGLRKAEVEPVKHFISKCEDNIRFAYARTSEIYPRQCVFIATTNNDSFLTDPTGNRRFMPVDVNTDKITRNVRRDLDSDTVDQIWAEAVTLYRMKEKLYLTGEAADIANTEQRNHTKEDPRKGIIEEYLNTLLPTDWGTRSLTDRRNFITEELAPKGTELREYVCIAEVWCECLGLEKRNMDPYKTRSLNEVLKSLDEWDYSPTVRKFPIYGRQRYFSRKLI